MSVGDVNSNEIGSGARYNDGKTRYDLIPTHLLKSTADVFEHGMKKYAAWNWAKGMTYSTIIGCMKRHLAAIEIGKDIDDGPKGSGFRHVGHMMCNLIMLEHYMNMIENDPSLKEKFDDRPTIFNKDKKDFDENRLPGIDEFIANHSADTLVNTHDILSK